MGTEIIRPLIKRTIVSPAVIHHRKRRGCHGNGNVNPRFEIGQVRILKRGESQGGENDRKARRISADDVITSRINRLGSESDAAAVDIKFMADIYAGSAFSMSPSPRSLPLPSFFNKPVDDSATRGLRRLLRLE